MPTVLHLSDFHFGRIDPRLLTPLLELAAHLNPDLVVVSGDLTQRARSHQFRAAKDFLNALPSPQIVVPGNHDVPMHNPVARFFYPLRGYRRYISDDPEPFYENGEIAVLGLNSSRSLTIQDGRLNDRQIDRLIRVFKQASPNTVKILVSHHPFEPSPGFETYRTVGGGKKVLAAMAACQADAILSGHLHTMHSACTALKEGKIQWSVLLSQAGTAISTRLRGQAPSFNVLQVGQQRIEIEPYLWDEAQSKFLPYTVKIFTRGVAGWISVYG
jgi:3',5'-cyclic AMP phosphodiesterase CpdA